MIAAASMVFLGFTPAFAADELTDPAASAESAPAAMEAAAAPAAEPAPEPAPAPAESAPAETPAAEPAPAPAPEPAPEPQMSAPETSTSSGDGVTDGTTSEEATTEEAAAEATDPQPPYLRWSVVNSDGTVQPGVTLRAQGPRDNSVADDGEDNQWAAAITMTVRDNTGQADYVGADLDPAAGEFLVKDLSDDADAVNTHEVQADETYRVQPTEVPEGFTTDEEAWQEIDVSNAAEDPVDDVVLQTEDAEQSFAPMSIGPTPPGGATINVNLNTLRTGSTAPTAGIQLRLHSEVSGGSGNSSYTTFGAALSQPWATCTTDVDGDCAFYVPAAGVGSNVRYWVVPYTTTGAGSLLNDSFVTGENTDSSSNSNRFAYTPYAFRTPVIRASATVYNIPGTGTGNMTDRSRVGNPGLPLTLTSATSDRWAHYPEEMIASLSNNRYQPTCQVGLKVALIVDLSTSMVQPDSTGLTGAKAAANAFVNAFANKGVNLGLYSFGSSANPTVKSPTTITSGNLNSFTTAINGMQVVGTQYTNWDKGIEQIQGQNFDIAVVLTDGNPTRYRNGGRSDSWTDMRGVEEATLSANLVKSQGTQILAFGVGAYLNSSLPENLQSVTGPEAWGSGVSIAKADYAITSNWSTVSAELANLASALTCEATVQVQKKERALNGNLSNGSGWVFTPTKTGNGTLTPNSAQTTNATGSLPNPWKVSFTESGQSASLQIAEQSKTNWQFESVSCLNHGSVMDGVTNAATFTLEGLKSGDSVVCTVINKAAPKDVGLTVTKKWVVNGVTYADGDQPAYAGTAALTLDPLPTGVTEPAFGTSYTYQQGDAVSIDEDFTTGNENCLLDLQKVTSVNGVVQDPVKGLPYAHTMALTPAPNTVTITNTVSCYSRITLMKDVENTHAGTGEISDFLLTAANVTRDILLIGHTGDDSITNQRITPGPISLSESGLTGYTSEGWECLNGTTPLDLDGNIVNVPAAANVVCTVTNHDDPGAVQWSKVAAANTNALLAGSEWSVENTTTNTTVAVIDCDESPCNGVDKDPVAGQFKLENLDWGEYTVTETKAPPGYVMEASFTFTVDATNAGTLQDIGKIENSQQAGVALPLTGGLSTDAFTIWGMSIAALAALLGAGYWGIRSRRQMEAA